MIGVNCTRRIGGRISPPMRAAEIAPGTGLGRRHPGDTRWKFLRYGPAQLQPRAPDRLVEWLEIRRRIEGIGWERGRNRRRIDHGIRPAGLSGIKYNESHTGRPLGQRVIVRRISRIIEPGILATL